MADDDHPGDHPGDTNPDASGADVALPQPAEPDTPGPGSEPQSAAATPEADVDAESSSAEPQAAEPQAPESSEPAVTESGGAGSDTPGTETAGADPSRSDSPSGVGATTPAWWTWVGHHRKPVAIVAALVVVAVVATAVTISVVTPGPKDVVQSYLDAIHAGDTQTALDIVGEPEDDGRLRFLSGEALADDWAVTSVVERHRREDEADVDVTITAGDTSEQGRFHVVKGEDGWTIESPFVRVDLLVSGLDTIELGSVREPVTGNSSPGDLIPLLLFPGVYDLYPSLGDRVTFDPRVLVAAPQPSTDSTTRVTAGYTFTDEGAAAANGAIAARVEECESMPGLAPDGCPFSAENEPAFYGFSDVVSVRWAVTTSPEARFAPTPGGALQVILKKPGTVTLTGSGIPYEPDGAPPERFSVTCEFGVDNMAVAVTVDGMTVNSGAGRPYAVAETTRCF